MENTVKFYSLSYSDFRSYLFSLLFVSGNIILPQICHLIPHGGLIFLPIYFFTLIAAYKYGIFVGLLTAIFSPLINSMLFEMPVVDMLPVVLAKSCLLAIVSSMLSIKAKHIGILYMVIIVLLYQAIGLIMEGFMLSDFNMALNSFKLGVPGMLMQVFGGYALLKVLSKI